MLLRCCLVFVAFLITATNVFAAQCLDIFPTVSQEYGPQLDLPNFKDSSKNDGDLSGSNLAVSAGQYDDINVNNNGVIFFTELNSDYRIDNLDLGNNVTAQFVGGDYFIDDLTINKDSNLAVVGSDTVRIYANTITIEKDVTINAANGKLILISYDDIDIEKNLKFTGVMYADDELNIAKDAEITGSITGGDVSISNPDLTNYQQTSITEADFNGMCDNGDSGPTPIPSCEILFPGDSPLASFGGIDDIDIKNNVTCNGGNCSIENVTQERLPTIPTGGTDLGEFNRGNLSDTDYNFYNNWKSNRTQVTYNQSSGTAVIYIESNGEDIKIPENTRLNTTNNPNPSEVLLVIKTNKKVEIGKDSTINAFLYIVADEEIKINEDVTINGALTVITDELIIEKDSTLTYDTGDLSDFDPHGFCDPVNPIVELVNYRFDESAWTGVAGEVTDQTGNFNAQSKNGADTAQSTPAIIGNPGTCGYGEFDGNNDYVALPNNFDNLQESFTITAWINPSNLSAGSRIFADDENNTQGYAFSLGDPGSGKLRFYSRGVSPISVDTSSSVIPSNTWTFVAAVHDSVNKTRQIYVNGVAQTVTGGGVSNTYSGTWGVDNGVASIGGETDSGETSNRFTGAIDEVRVYNGALSQAEIAAIENETHPCDSFIDHFEIDVIDGQGLTCEADNITIRACANASCTTLNPDATDVQLSVNGSIEKTVTVTGSANTTISFPTVGQATLSLDQTYSCINGNPGACDISFEDTGFRFFANNEGTPIPTQISGKPSNVGFNASNLKVQAIEKNPDTGACQAALTDTTAIEMAATCVDPVACAGSQVSINNLSNPTNIVTLNNAVSLTYSSVALDFGDDTQNSANFHFSYPDAGKVLLHIRYNIPDEDGNPTGNYMLGASNTFVVRPFGFYVDVVGNPRAQSASGDKFIAAGEDFSTRLTAVQWQAEDDDLTGEANNGIPDSDADLSNNGATVNFGQEINAESALVSHAIVLPSAGILGDLTNINFTSFGSGTSLVDNMTYDEVGIINLAANLSDNSYLGADDVTGYEPYVGRFIPHHFELTIDKEGSLAALCQGIDPVAFAYIGQTNTLDATKGVLEYLVQPTAFITPQAKLNTHTQNYTGDFNKLLLTGVKRFQVDNGSGVMVDAPIEDTARLGADTINKVKLTANFSDATLTESGGILTFEYSLSDNFIYTHEQNSEIPPFTSDINLSIASVIDEDDVAGNDADGTGDTGIATDTVITFNPIGKEIRFGRAFLANSFGPETSNLPQPFSVQYLNASASYVTNEQDNCTDFDATNIVLTSGTLNKNLTGVNVATGQLDDELPNGETKAMELTAPGSGNQGTVNVEYDIYSWLKYDWDWNGVTVKAFDENPTAVATFGLFRGNDRIIYQREVNN